MRPITPRDLTAAPGNNDDNIYTQENFDNYVQSLNALKTFETGLQKQGQGNNNPQNMDEDAYTQWQQLQQAVQRNPFAKNREKYTEFIRRQNPASPASQSENNMGAGQNPGSGQTEQPSMALPARAGEAEYSIQAMEDELRRKLRGQ